MPLDNSRMVLRLAAMFREYQSRAVCRTGEMSGRCRPTFVSSLPHRAVWWRRGHGRIPMALVAQEPCAIGTDDWGSVPSCLVWCSGGAMNVIATFGWHCLRCFCCRETDVDYCPSFLHGESLWGPVQFSLTKRGRACRFRRWRCAIAVSGGT